MQKQNDLYEAVVKHIHTKQLLKKGDRVLLAVSGGADSMALLHMLKRLSKSMSLHLIVVTIDHQLRGESSAADADFVVRFCEENKIVVFKKEVDVRLYKAQHKVSTQVAARTLRYACFRDVMIKHQAQVLLTGHHGDDCLETFLMHIAKTTHPDALVGMPVIRPFSTGMLARPLIVLSKSDIYRYLAHEGVPFKEDQSNEDTRYRRNHIRHDVLPHLKRDHPALLKTTKVLMSHLKDDRDYLNHQAEKLYRQIVKTEEAGRVLTVEIDEIKKSFPALQRRLFHLILNYLYVTVPPTLSYKHEVAFLKLLEDTSGHRSIDLPGGYVMKQVYHRLYFMKAQHIKTGAIVKTNKDVIFFGEHRIEKQIVTCVKRQTKDVLYVSKDLYDQGFYTMRGHKAGDRIYLPNGRGSKKVSRVFIDEKIPIGKRADWPLVVDQRDHVIWVVGLTKPDFSLDRSETHYMKFTYQP